MQVDQEFGIRPLGPTGNKTSCSFYGHCPINPETCSETALIRRMEEGPGEGILGP